MLGKQDLQDWDELQLIHIIKLPRLRGDLETD